MMSTMFLSRISTRLKYWHELFRQRRELETLSDHLLQDIGLSRNAAHRTVSRRSRDQRRNRDRTLRERGRREKAPSGAKGKAKCCPQA